MVAAGQDSNLTLRWSFGSSAMPPSFALSDFQCLPVRRFLHHRSNPQTCAFSPTRTRPQVPALTPTKHNAQRYNQQERKPSYYVRVTYPEGYCVSAPRAHTKRAAVAHGPSCKRGGMNERTATNTGRRFTGNWVAACMQQHGQMPGSERGDGPLSSDFAQEFGLSAYWLWATSPRSRQMSCTFCRTVLRPLHQFGCRMQLQTRSVHQKAQPLAGR